MYFLTAVLVTVISSTTAETRARMAEYASSLTSVIVQVVGVEKNATVYQYKGALLHV